ncbi:MAG: ISPs1, transposase OrfA [Phycisphaerales bacterium]|nr:ISPs1, transposase OrfA [Phycisphaerales bacterium]
MHRYELDDWAWALVEPLLPPRRTRGRWWRDHRQVINGIFWILFSGAPWRDLPDRYGPWQTAHRRLSCWRADGTWEKVLHRLRLRADRVGLLDYARWNIDSTSIRSGRPRDRIIARRAWHQTAPGHRRERPADRLGNHRRQPQ